MAVALNRIFFPLSSIECDRNGPTVRAMVLGTFRRAISLLVVGLFFCALAVIAIICDHHASTGFALGGTVVAVLFLLLERLLTRWRCEEEVKFIESLPPFADVRSLDEIREILSRRGNLQILKLLDTLKELDSLASGELTDREKQQLLDRDEDVCRQVATLRFRFNYRFREGEVDAPIYAAIYFHAAKIGRRLNSFRNNDFDAASPIYARELETAGCV